MGVGPGVTYRLSTANAKFEGVKGDLPDTFIGDTSKNKTGRLRRVLDLNKCVLSNLIQKQPRRVSMVVNVLNGSQY